MTDFVGTSGNDTFTGGPGADNASGGDGADKLYGGDGADKLDGGNGSDVLSSSDDPGTYRFPYFQDDGTAPLLDTGATHDVLYGGAGSDTIFAGYGDDADGGASMAGYPEDSNDLFISFEGASAGVVADFTQTSLVIGGGTIQNFNSLGWVQGSDFNDKINAGLPESNGYSDFTVVQGMGGDDTIIGGYYTGNIYGGDGNDIIDGRSAAYLETIDGGAGNDTLYSYDGLDSTFGGDGDDTIYGSWSVDGGRGDDTIFVEGLYADQPVTGGDGNDAISALADHGYRELTADGGAGSDVLTGISGQDNLTGGDGSDILVSALSNPLVDYDGRAQQDTLLGGAGDDKITAGFNDVVDGGDGFDTLRLTLLDDHKAIKLDTGDILSAAGWANGAGSIKGIEQIAWLQGTHQADTITIAAQTTGLTLEADAGGDTVIVHGTGNTIYGGDGDDIVRPSVNGNVIDGGDGSDTIDYSTAAAGAIASIVAAEPVGTADLTGDLLVSVEQVLGSAFGDTLIGGSGADHLSGLAGDDTLDGGLGHDTLTGGAGNDTYVVDSGHDTVVENANEGNDAVVAAVSWTLGSNLENLTLSGDHGNAGTGNELDNHITGNAGANTLTGLAGNDVLDGGAGYDTLVGGTGNDVYVVDSGHDRVIENADEGNDTIVAGVSWTLGDNLENLALSGSRGNSGTGNALDNTITGNGGLNHLYGMAGNDTISGGNGDDVIRGGAGLDVVTGGKGQDLFVFADGDFAGVKQSDCDRITDFQTGWDKIDLSGVDAVQGGGDDAFRFLGTAAFDGHAGEIRTFTSHGDLYLEADTNGDRQADLRIALDHVSTVSAADFVL